MIKIALFGVGNWGPNLLRNFQNNLDSQVEWVVDSDPARLELVLQRFPGIKVSQDPEPAFADQSVGAAVIATPPRTHYGLARRAMENGMHVLVEKPLTRSTAEAESLCEFATKASLILMVGHVFLYNSAVQKVKECLDDGELGDVYYISMTRTSPRPSTPDVNASWDLAAHDISIANFWLGSEPLSVSASGASVIDPYLEDVVFSSFEYPGGVMVNIQSGWLNPRKVREVTLVAERKVLTFDDMNFDEPIRIYRNEVVHDPKGKPYVDSFSSFRASTRGADISIPTVALSEPLKAECDHFIACICQGLQPRTDAKSGLAVVRALDAMQSSLSAAGLRQPVIRP